MAPACAYCRQPLEPGAASDEGDDTLMCPACVAHFQPFWEGMALADFLERFEHPVLVTDGSARVIACNERGARLLGRDRSEFVGRLAGDAVACVNSRLPGGCGRTAHCRECTLRRTIERTGASGAPIEGVPAWLDTAAGRVPLRVSSRPVGGAIRVVLEELGPPDPTKGPPR